VSAPGWWNPEASAASKLLLAAAALAALLRYGRLRQLFVPGRPRRLLGILGVLGFLAYFNFGAFHFGGIYVHLWDTFHHVLGAKYADELQYDLLYECVTVADAEEPGGAAAARARQVIDLRTNHISAGEDVLAHPERCRDRFSKARWADFKRDVGFFRARFPEADWQRVTLDHGFNASPVWLFVAHPLVGRGPMTGTRLAVLSAIDPVLMVAGFVAVAWAFGAAPAALAAVVWGTYFPARLWWTGGAFLRWDWLAALLAGVALCRRGRSYAGGALLGYSALSRVFPVLALAGALLAWLVARLRRRAVDPAVRRVLLGALGAAAILVPLSAAVRGPRMWQAFARNLSKHTSVASPNRMGLGVLVAFDPETRFRALPDGPDIRQRWESAQDSTLRGRRAIWIVLAAAGAGAVALAVREQPAWAACLLGLLLVPLFRPLACYYYAFVAALPLLAEQSLEAGGIAVALALASGIVARFSEFGMDEQYAAQSLLVMLTFAYAASCFVGRRPADR
jgi:hypothetical protein